jgi:broad-specificity NMP kinase
MFNRLFNGIKTLAMSSTIKPDVVFVLGAPGAGKGTQCENIVKVSFDVKIYCSLLCPL